MLDTFWKLEIKKHNNHNKDEHQNQARFYVKR